MATSRTSALTQGGALVDRSAEFAQLVATRRSRSGAALAPGPAPSKSGVGASLELSRQQQTINTLAADIGHELWHTSQRLAELTRLAQSQSPFSDQSSRIDELTHAVKSDLARLQQALGVLETHVRNARASSTNPQSAHAHEHAHSVVHALQGRLLDTTRGFAHALQTRTSTLRAHEQRRARIGAASSALSTLRSAESAAAAQDEGELSVAIAVPTLRHQTQQQRSLVVERSEQVRDIEASIAEVQGVFRKLAELVTLQGEQIARIEDNVLLSEVHANEAHRQLTHYLSAVSSDRWLAAKLFGVLLLFIFLFVLFFL